MKKKPAIAFLFLDELHHLGHFVSVAVELSKTTSVSILTYPAKHKFLFDLLEKLGGNVKVEQLRTQPFREFTDLLKKRELPRKGFWIKKNQAYIFRNFDAIVFTDFFHQPFLKARGEKPCPKFLFFTHGSPGRGFSYKSDIKDFDFQILTGSFHYQKFLEKNLLAKHFAVVGYPKFDTVSPSPKSFFEDKKPIVLYNPHFTKSLTSWHKMGLEILQFFYSQTAYNLIFAPHLNLFKARGGESPVAIPEKFFKAKNIFIDLGSEASVNMKYVFATDIYLGDVSSQVFEFIHKPRPCVFLNPEGVDFEGDENYRFWQCGEVIETVGNLKNSLDSATAKFESFKPIQQKLAAENFYTEANSTASERAAQAVLSYLEEAL